VTIFEVSGAPYPVKITFISTKDSKEARRHLKKRYPKMDTEHIFNRAGCSFWTSEDSSPYYRTYFIWILNFRPSKIEDVSILTHEIYHTVKDIFHQLEILEEECTEAGAYYFDHIFAEILTKAFIKKEKK
jgi:hypothetical protein